MRFLFILMIALMPFSPVKAQDFRGTFEIESPGGPVTLRLESYDGIHYSGQFQGNGQTLSLAGQIQTDILLGTLEDEEFVFQAQLQGGMLNLTLAETDGWGNPDPESIQYFSLRPAKAASRPEQKQMSQPVIINGMGLTPAQIAEIEQTYGITPKPGQYWYDTVSGLYGVVGYDAFGYMLPGHNFGALSQQASNGNTRVMINGRELSQSEWTVWSYIIGRWIQPGRYWLDAQGNAGYEGNPIPVLNLFVLARQNAYQGQGGSGDNFWSSRFSAGNSNANNTQGYVSVPGYGPVGYGF